MKKHYEEPMVAINNLIVEDVIATSNNGYWSPDMEED